MYIWYYDKFFYRYIVLVIKNFYMLVLVEIYLVLWDKFNIMIFCFVGVLVNSLDIWLFL